MSEDTDVIELIDTDKIAIRAWLLGKLQTSLMRDGWGVTGIDQPAGTLTVIDGQYSFTVSLSIPEAMAVAEPPPAVAVRQPTKRTSPKRKR